MIVHIVWRDQPWEDPDLCEIFENEDDATAYIKDKLSGIPYKTEAVHWTTFFIFKDLFKGKPSGREQRYWVGDHEVHRQDEEKIMIGDTKDGPIWVCLDCTRLYYWDEEKQIRGCLNPDCGGDLVRISWMREFLKLLDGGYYEIRGSNTSVRKEE